MKAVVHISNFVNLIRITYISLCPFQIEEISENFRYKGAELGQAQPGLGLGLKILT